MSNNTDYHLNPFKEGEFNPIVVIIFVIIVCLILIGFYIYRKYYMW